MHAYTACKAYMCAFTIPDTFAYLALRKSIGYVTVNVCIPVLLTRMYADISTMTPVVYLKFKNSGPPFRMLSSSIVRPAVVMNCV